MNKIEEIINNQGQITSFNIKKGLFQYHVSAFCYEDGKEYWATGDTLEAAFIKWHKIVQQREKVTSAGSDKEDWDKPLDLLKTYSIQEIYRLFKTKAGHLLKIDENPNKDGWVLDGLVWEDGKSTQMKWNAYGTACCDNRDYDLILDPIGHIEPLDQAFVLEFNPWFRFCVDSATKWYEYGKAFGVNERGVNLFDWQGYSKFYPFKDMREKDWSYSLDGGKQWLPCRKNEPEN